jgi:hypothetical protein
MVSFLLRDSDNAANSLVSPKELDLVLLIACHRGTVIGFLYI